MYNFVLIKLDRRGKLKWYRKFITLKQVNNFIFKKKINFNLCYDIHLRFYAYELLTIAEFEHLYSDKI